MHLKEERLQRLPPLQGRIVKLLYMDVVQITRQLRRGQVSKDVKLVLLRLLPRIHWSLQNQPLQ